MAHRAATDEICVTGGYGERPIKQKAGTRQSLRLLSFGSKRPCLPKPRKNAAEVMTLMLPEPFHQRQARCGYGYRTCTSAVHI